MLRPCRLVGWWVAGSITAFASGVRAQATASFPEEPPAGTAKPPPKRAPAPSARPAPAPPARPSAPPRSTPAPKAAPPARPSPAPLPPIPSPRPWRDSGLPIADLPRAGNDTRPPLLPYREGLPVPAGYQIVTRPATGLTTAGVVGLVTTYGVAVIIGATQGFRNGTGWLAVPIAGPWAAIGARTYECEGPTGTVAEAKRCVRDAVGEVQIITFVAVDGIAQLASAVVTLAGLASSRQELVRKDLLPVDVAVVPPRGREPWRLSVSGTF